jgi:hypothetical protein
VSELPFSGAVPPRETGAADRPGPGPTLQAQRVRVPDGSATARAIEYILGRPAALRSGWRCATSPPNGSAPACAGKRP